MAHSACQPYAFPFGARSVHIACAKSTSVESPRRCVSLLKAALSWHRHARSCRGGCRSQTCLLGRWASRCKTTVKCQCLLSALSCSTVVQNMCSGRGQPCCPKAQTGSRQRVKSSVPGRFGNTIRHYFSILAPTAPSPTPWLEHKENVNCVCRASVCGGPVKSNTKQMIS